jgi:DNA-binding CsgD family transcriptional regulator/PAS domain-containing protein
LVTSPKPRGNIDEILLAAYDVAAGSMDWPQLSDSLAESLDGKSVTLFVLDERIGSASVLATSGTEGRDRIGAYLTIARKKAGPMDASRRPEVRESRRVTTGSMASGVTRWNSLSEPGMDYVAGMRLAGAGEELCLCIGVEVETANPILVDKVHEQVEILLPHFCRAAEIDRRLRAATERSNFSNAVFDRLPFGLVRFDENEAVIYANAEASRISRLREGFSIVAHRVRARSSADDIALQNAIREAVAAGGHPYTRRFNLKRDTGQRPYGLLLTTLSYPRAAEGHRPGCVLFITDGERPSTIGPEAVAEMFGLTMAEAKVVAHLAMGASLREVAGKLKVSINTARTLLARAMAKTGTNTQIGLVRMVLTTLSPIGDDRR